MKLVNHHGLLLSETTGKNRNRSEIVGIEFPIKLT